MQFFLLSQWMAPVDIEPQPQWMRVKVGWVQSYNGKISPYQSARFHPLMDVNIAVKQPDLEPQQTHPTEHPLWRQATEFMTRQKRTRLAYQRAQLLLNTHSKNESQTSPPPQLISIK